MNILIANHKVDQVNKLRKFLVRYDESIKVIKNSVTLKETIDFYENSSEKVDLAFFETDLADGSSFEIINKVPIKNPIVFTSSTEDDAYKAIKANGLDYLLEPLTYLDVSGVLNKITNNKTNEGNSTEFIPLENNIEFKKRFLVKYGDKMQFKNVDDVAYFFADGKVVYFITRTTNRKYIVDYALDELEKKLLNPDYFFRINRKYIIHIDMIEEVRTYANSRLKLILNSPNDKDMIVSRDKVNNFKNWLNL